jgi:hypothetical protein
MNNRICPDEILLSEYMEGFTGKEEKDKIEQHIAGCGYCRETLRIAFAVTRKSDLLALLSAKILKNGIIYYILSLGMLILSFFWKRYFIQCIVLSVLLSLKAIFYKGLKETILVLRENKMKQNKS